METRQIVAVVVIIVIVAGVGVGLWLFMPAAPYGALVVGQVVTPGAPAGTPSEQIITVGLLDDLTYVTGEGAWKGAYMAIDEINTAGGIEIDGVTYYLGLVAEDTSEAAPQLDIAKGTAAATKIITQDGAQFIVGGFRTEAVLAYVEDVMDEEMLFLGTGAATDDLCENVLDDYDRYKYFFRLMPINTTTLIRSLFAYTAYLKGFLNATQGINVTKVALMREDAAWTAAMPAVMNASLPLFGMELVADIAFPLDAEATDFATFWNQIQTSGAQITVPILSGSGGILMTTQYAQVQPKCVLAGINVMGQLESYWNETGGACRYEILLQSIHETAKTPDTLAFWDDFLDLYEGEPLYTAVGAYDAMFMLAEAIENAQSLVSADIVPHLEAFTTSSPYGGVGGIIGFTESHDLFSSPSFSFTLFCQWQAGGTKVVLPNGGLVYSDDVATGTLSLPPWGINP